MWLGIIIFCLITAFFIIGYKGFANLKNKADEAYLTLNIYLKNRYELILNIISIVKEYNIKEPELINKVIKARNNAAYANKKDEIQENEYVLAYMLKKFFTVLESTIAINENEKFINLKEKIKKNNQDIIRAGKYYNAVLKTYNKKRELFPQTIIAGLFNFKKLEYFSVDDVT